MIASSTAATTVTCRNGCGVVSTTRSTPRLASFGQAVLGDGRRHDGLAGQVFETESGEFVVRRDDHVAVPGGAACDLVADPLRRGDEALPDPSWNQPHGQAGHVAGDAEHPGGGAQRCRVEGGQRVGVLDVGGELRQDLRGTRVVAAAENQGASVGEVARGLGLHRPDGPLLEYVGELVAVGDGDVSTGVVNRFDLGIGAVEEAHRARLAYA
ncbi:MAG: hypothetical protein V9G04_17490 [Nocardioides sp.]